MSKNCNCKNKKTIFALVAFVLVVAALATVYLITKPKGDGTRKEITVTIVHGDKTEKVLELTTRREFLSEALIDEELFTAEDIASGLTNVIDGETADAEKMEWWCINVNGEMAMVGMKEIALTDGGKYELVFTVGYDFF